MMITLRQPGGILILSNDPAKVRQALPFGRAWREDWRQLSLGEAEEILRRFGGSQENEHEVRAALCNVDGDGGVLHRTPIDTLIRRAARLLEFGWLVEITRTEPSGGIPPGNQPATLATVTEAVEPEENPTGLPKEKEKDHWIVVELVGENGEPIPNELCRVTTPDGDVVEEETNSQGKVEIYQISAGDCVIEFPELDKDAWEPAPGDGAV